jgi:hypothetical protein
LIDFWSPIGGKPLIHLNDQTITTVARPFPIDYPSWQGYTIAYDIQTAGIMLSYA